MQITITVKQDERWRDRVAKLNERLTYNFAMNMLGTYPKRGSRKLATNLNEVFKNMSSSAIGKLKAKLDEGQYIIVSSPKDYLKLYIMPSELKITVKG